MIKRATVDDIYDIHNLEKRVFPQPLDLEFLYDELAINPFAKYYVYEQNKKIVGYLGYRVIDDTAEMMNFIVDPKHQKQGIGKTLISDTIDELIKQGVKMITLEVRKSNKIAIKLYESVGFKRSHIRRNYYQTEDGLVYLKEII
ncbi:MAG: ribosomal protein S18-alanine N-acetyltransferase [Acholeplasmataceae bacterium]